MSKRFYYLLIKNEKLKIVLSEDCKELLDEAGEDEKGNFFYLIKLSMNRNIYQKGDNLDIFYNSFMRNCDSYGVDQGAFRESYYEVSNNCFIPNKDYFDNRSILMDKYNMSYIDAVKTLEIIDSVGACTYAATVNMIVNIYKGNPKGFERTFGFSLYKNDYKGRRQLNDKELLVDLYLYCNSTENGGKVFEKNEEGNIIIKDDLKTKVDERIIEPNYSGFDAKKYGDKQVYLSDGIIGVNSKIINKYLNSKKGNNIKISSYMVNPDTVEQVENLIEEKFFNGDIITVGIYKNTKMTKIFNAETFEIGGGHSIIVTDVIEGEGVIVDSWGESYFISYEEIVQGNKMNEIEITKVIEKNKK